jgi:hypothetical protein
MAFSFVVEIGEADPDANSYCTVEFADDYLEANPHVSADWLDQEEEDKQRLLVRASKVIDYRFKWHGTKSDADSGLRWPRAGAYDEDGFEIPDNVIPRILKEAVAEFAAYLMQEDWTAPRSGGGEIAQVKVDVIDVKFNTRPEDAGRGVMPESILAMLESLGNAQTGRRPGFKRIVRS